ncbi:MAG: hypothetical protein AAGC46_20330 [Solirubrobacteraceae bacterium]
MPVPTQPTPGTPDPTSPRAPRAPRRQRGGRPARKRAPLSPLQAKVLLTGGILVATLLYLVVLRGGQDKMVRVDGSRINVTLREFSISPQSVSVKQGNVAVYATNLGHQVHNLVIETIVPRSSDEKATPVLQIPSMRPGESHSNGAVLAPGKYRWRSSISNDDDLGMYGTIEVRQ